jgi:hypothetical protein
MKSNFIDFNDATRGSGVSQMKCFSEKRLSFEIQLQA